MSSFEDRDEKERQRGRGKRLFEGGDYFKYFNQKVVVIQGWRLIEGWLLFNDLR